MAAIAPFLADIGASELSPRVQKGSHKVRGLQERISAEVQHTERAIQELLESRRDEFEAQERRTAALENQLQEVKAESAEAKSELQREKQTLKSILVEHAASHDAELRSRHLSEAVEALHKAQEALKQTASALERNELDVALQHLSQELGQRDQWYTRTTQWRSIVEWQEDLQTQIGSRVQDAANDAVHIDHERRSLTLTSDDTVLQSLNSNLDRLGLLDPHLKQVAVKLERHLLRPYFQNSPSLSFVKTSSSSIELQNTPEPAPLSTLNVFLDFMRSRLPKTFSSMSSSISEELQNYLSAVLPGTTKGLASFQLQLQTAQSLDATFFGSESKIKYWHNSLPLKWAQKVIEQKMSACRNLVLQPGAKGWESIQVEFEPSETFAPVASSSSSTQEQPPAPAQVSSDPPPNPPAMLQPRPVKPSHRRNYSVATVAADDDEWGFGDEAEDIPEEEPPDLVEPEDGDVTLNQADAEDSGWGFDEDDTDGDEDEEKPLNIAAAKPATKLMKAKKADLRPPSPPQPTSPQPSEHQGDGWGFEESPVPAQGEMDQNQRIEAEPQPSKVKFSVSAHSQQVLDLAKSVLDLLAEVEQPSFELRHEQANIQPYFLQAFVDVFDLFRATMPLAQKQIISSVPALGMQLANDCDWLAQQLVQTASDNRFEQGSFVPALNASFDALRSFAKAERQRQMDLQWAALSESLEDTRRFADVADAMVFATCERAMRQINHTLERLAHVWRPVMDQKTYLSTMGTLVNQVLERIIGEILAQTDIGEQESQNLSTLCKSLHGLQDIFTEGDQTLVGPFVPLWFKLLYLSEILEGSMVDIMYLFEEGTLVDFTTEEMVRLVRALFSESATRQRNIDKIRSSSTA